MTHCILRRSHPEMHDTNVEYADDEDWFMDSDSGSDDENDDIECISISKEED
mgnify:CR=1 FL=1